MRVQVCKKKVLSLSHENCTHTGLNRIMQLCILSGDNGDKKGMTHKK